MSTDLNGLLATYIPLVEAEMRAVIAVDGAGLDGHYGMLRYHMGWADAQLRAAEVNGGKRIRPLLCLLACEAVGGRRADAVPAAAAIELLHNFSLIHDDIEDDSPTRRHRPTVWALWGRAQAINAGDALFTLARMALHRLQPDALPVSTILRAFEVFDVTCLRLTEGQYLDMSFESRLDVTADEYLQMIAGKTAALLGASLEIGALIGDATGEERESLADFGSALGMAFQIRDDWLGIWGDEVLTGKSAQSDILSRKKSLPVVFALMDSATGPALGRLYSNPIGPAEVPVVLDLLQRAGARERTEAVAREAHERALAALAASGVLRDGNEAAQALFTLAETLLNRSA